MWGVSGVDMSELVQLKQADIKTLRDKLLIDQGGICPICKKEIKSKAVLDHQHKKRIKGSGLVRGVLCLNCNVFISKSENGCIRYNISQKELPGVLRNMADYFEAPHTNMIHPSEKEKDPVLSKRSFQQMAKKYKEMFPKKKELLYPKSGHLTKAIELMYKAVELEPVFLGKDDKVKEEI